MDEFSEAAVGKEPSVTIRPPRVAQSPAVLECRLHQVIPVGDSFLVLGQVTHVSVDTDVLTTDARGRTLPDARLLDPMARLGRNEWSTLGEVLSVQRPQARQ